jgi:hypothetical protein
MPSAFDHLPCRYCPGIGAGPRAVTLCRIVVRAEPVHELRVDLRRMEDGSILGHHEVKAAHPLRRPSVPDLIVVLVQIVVTFLLGLGLAFRCQVPLRLPDFPCGSWPKVSLPQQGMSEYSGSSSYDGSVSRILNQTGVLSPGSPL